MKYALAIVTYVPHGAEEGTAQRLRTAMTSLTVSAYDGPVYIVDDGSTQQDHLDYLASLTDAAVIVRRPTNGGIARAKNTCLRVLAEHSVDLGFVAEDDILFRAGWHEAYVMAHVKTRVNHFSWAWDDDPSGKMRKDVRYIHSFPVVATTRVNGVFLTFTSSVLEVVGGFRVMPAPWGHEHTHWSRRIVKAGLAPHFIDIVDSNRYIGLSCNAMYSTISAADRKRCADLNEPFANDLSTLYHPLTE